MVMNGRLISRGSFTIQSSFASLLSAAGSIPSFFALGLRSEKSPETLPPASDRNSSLVNFSRKKSRS